MPDHAHLPGDAERDLAALIDITIAGDMNGMENLADSMCITCVMKKAVSILAGLQAVGTLPGLSDVIRRESPHA